MMESAGLKPVTLSRKETKTMSEETLPKPLLEAPCKPKRNWSALLLAGALICVFVNQIRLFRKYETLEKRVTAVENMFAK